MTIDQILNFFLNLTWQATAMLENIGNAITRLPMDGFGPNLVGRFPSRPRHICHDVLAMATAVA